ncbi:MAG: DUF1015 domain-containing protein [Clostridia bacterium]|nr:DUF1015 domain-containing protein [Clostridia bacterium]
MKHSAFGAADILLPDFDRVSGTQWSVVACDQFTSEKAYWEKAEETVGESPSTLRMILPEAYLAETETRVPQINETMRDYCDRVLCSHPDSMIYLERLQSDGTVRRGIIGKVDLEEYDYRKGSQSSIRATEGTVLERIPPRVAVRRGAVLELPHVMLLIDDPHRTVIEPIAARAGSLAVAYDFDLMLKGGHVCGRWLDRAAQAEIEKALTALVAPEQLAERYGDAALSPLLFAVGDGNHSLASAKEAYREIREQIGEEAAKQHPARYALVEIVNLHDEALSFQPIYRVVFGVDPQSLLSELQTYAAGLQGEMAAQKVAYVGQGLSGEIVFANPARQLTVGTLQDFLDLYVQRYPGAEVDYIHGEGSVRVLSDRPDAIGFLFDGMGKDQLFRTVIYDGALPRKTFSMGHAEDKRYYLEARRIKA